MSDIKIRITKSRYCTFLFLPKPSFYNFIERTANSAVSERESQYEQQLKEYQSNINQAIRETDKVRAELKQIQDENSSKEKQTNDLINSLKQELTDRG